MLTVGKVGKCTKLAFRSFTFPPSGFFLPQHPSDHSFSCFLPDEMMAEYHYSPQI